MKMDARQNLSIFWGSVFVILMALKKLPIPGTDISISVQSLSISLLVLALGRNAYWSVLFYLILACCGLPVLTGGTSNAHWLLSPLAGYFIGFLVSGWLLPRILEGVKPKNFLKTWLCLACNESIILGFGFLSLTFHLGFSQAWSGGVRPYLLGAVLKISCATILYLIYLPGFKSSTILK